MRKIFPELIQPRASSDEWLWKRKVGRNPQSDQKQLNQLWTHALEAGVHDESRDRYGTAAVPAPRCQSSRRRERRLHLSPPVILTPATTPLPSLGLGRLIIEWLVELVILSEASEVRQQNWISSLWTCDRGSLFLISLRWAESEAIIDCSDMVSNKGIWRSEQRTTKMKTSTTILLLLCLIGMTSSQSGIRILPDGGYSDIVVRIADSVNQDYCSQYIKHLTVSFSSPTCLSPSHLRSPTNPSLSVSSSPSIHSHKPLFFISFFPVWPGFIYVWMFKGKVQTVFPWKHAWLVKNVFWAKTFPLYIDVFQEVSNVRPVSYHLLVISII